MLVITLDLFVTTTFQNRISACSSLNDLSRWIQNSLRTSPFTVITTASSVRPKFNLRSTWYLCWINSPSVSVLVWAVRNSSDADFTATHPRWTSPIVQVWSLAMASSTRSWFFTVYLPVLWVRSQNPSSHVDTNFFQYGLVLGKKPHQVFSLLMANSGIDARAIFNPFCGMSRLSKKCTRLSPDNLLHNDSVWLSPYTSADTLDRSSKTPNTPDWLPDIMILEGWGENPMACALRNLFAPPYQINLAFPRLILAPSVHAV